MGKNITDIQIPHCKACNKSLTKVTKDKCFECEQKSKTPSYQ